MDEAPLSPKFNIVIDTREQLPWAFNKSSWVSGITNKKLDQGDYAIEGHENLISIERKRSTGEIATNIFEKRFEDELQRLSDIVIHPFIICEFDFLAMRTFPSGSGIPQFRWKYLKTTSPILMKSITIFQLKYPKVKWVFTGGVDSGREHALSLMKTCLQLNGLIGK